jgi:hypothetical protein
MAGLYGVRHSRSRLYARTFLSHARFLSFAQEEESYARLKVQHDCVTISSQSESVVTHAATRIFKGFNLGHRSLINPD